MKEGKSGVKLWYYAVAAFIFGALNLYLGILAVAAFALIAEKDKWLNNQVIAALLLYLIYSLSALAVDWSVGGLAKLFLLIKIYSPAAMVTQIAGIIKDVIFVIYLVFDIIAILRCAAGKDGVPYLTRISDKAQDIANKENTPEENKEGINNDMKSE